MQLYHGRLVCQLILHSGRSPTVLQDEPNKKLPAGQVPMPGGFGRASHLRAKGGYSRLGLSLTK